MIIIIICIYVLHINIVGHSRYCLEVSNHKHGLSLDERTVTSAQRTTKILCEFSS